MKTSHRFIVFLMVIAVSISALTTTVYASCIDTFFNSFRINTNTAFYLLNAREKEDATPLYLCITYGSIDRAKVAAYGRPIYDMEVENGITNNHNLTYSNGKLVPFVICYINLEYSIQSLIYEEGYPWAVLGFATTKETGGIIGGKWSPDSCGTYTYAQP